MKVLGRELTPSQEWWSDVLSDVAIMIIGIVFLYLGVVKFLDLIVVKSLLIIIGAYCVYLSAKLTIKRLSK
jgi:hypothetical protein